MKTTSFTRNHFIHFFTTACMIMTFLSTLVVIHALTLEPMVRTFEKEGGGAAIIVKGSGTEKWTAKSSVSWINITPTTSGTGDGIVSYIVSANRTSGQRIGIITIGGIQHTVYQNGYEATIFPTEAMCDLNGGVGTIRVTADTGIAWDAKSNVSWISITSGASGTGSGTVIFKVSSYSGSVATRIGTLTICGKTCTVTQTGEDVIISPVSANVDENSNIVLFNINALSTTSWTIEPNAEWISVLSKPNGYGDAAVTLSVTANLSYNKRTGTVSVGSKKFTITQAGTSQLMLSIDPTSVTAEQEGAYGRINVFATQDAPWITYCEDPWISITSGQTGTGDGNINYVVSANPNLNERIGRIFVLLNTGGGGKSEYFDRWNLRKTLIENTSINSYPRSLITKDISINNAINLGKDSYSRTINIWSKGGANIFLKNEYNKLYLGKDKGSNENNWYMYTITLDVKNFSRSNKYIRQYYAPRYGFMGGESIPFQEWEITSYCDCFLNFYKNGEKIATENVRKNIGKVSTFENRLEEVVSGSRHPVYKYMEETEYKFYYDLNTSGYCNDYSVYSNAFTDAEIKNLYEKERYPSYQYNCGECMIVQAAKKPFLDETGKEFSATGGSGEFQLNVANGVIWSAKSNDSWIKLLSPKTNVSGSGSVRYEVESNNSVYPRKGTLTVAGLTYTVTQGVRSHSIDNTEFSFGPDGGMDAANFVTEAGAEWKSVASDEWIKIAEGQSGTGPSGIIFILAPYTAPTSYRIGTITIGSAIITIRQYGYQSSVTPLVQEIPPNGGRMTLDVTVPFGAVWEAASRAGWITFVGGPDYTGSGTLTYIVAPNLTSGPRSAKLYIAGQEVLITQSEVAEVIIPTITMQPQSQTVNEGSSVTFSVTASGTTPLSYQWKKNGSNISGATSSSYKISSAKPSDAGSYTVTVSNSAGSVTSSAAALTVNASFTYHPADTNKDKMIKITEVTAYGKAWKSGETWPEAPNPIPISYLTRAGALWKNGEVYTQDKSKEPPLCWENVTAVAAASASAYCTISGEKVTITVTPDSGVSVYAAEDMIPSGWTVTGINENGVFDSTNRKVKWGPWFDNSPRTLTYTLVVPSGFSGTATLSGTASFDGVDMVITGDRQYGKSSSSNQAVSKISGNQVTITVTPGSDVSVYAAEDKIPSGLTVTGINESGVFDTANRKVKWGPWFDNSSRTLTYSLVPGSFSGTATLSGTASFDGVDVAITGDRQYTVSSAVKPTITTQPKSQTVNEGDSVTFSVTASGTAPLSYQWRKNGSNISGATASTYKINSAKASDAGSYTVTVSNNDGSVTSGEAKLTVNVPVTVSSISISGSDNVNVGSMATYACTATYSDKSTKTVIPTWSISSGETYANITSNGILIGKAVGVLTVKATYTENGQTKVATKNIKVNAESENIIGRWNRLPTPKNMPTSESFWDWDVSRYPVVDYERGIMYKLINNGEWEFWKYSIQDNTFIRIPVSNFPLKRCCYIYNPDENSIWITYVGRGATYRLPVTGGESEYIGGSGTYSDNFNSIAYWNSCNKKFSLLFGYGGNLVKNWCWQFGIGDANWNLAQENVAGREPWQRTHSALTVDPSGKKIFVGLGIGNSTGRQNKHDPSFVNNGNYDYLRDLWCLHLEDNTWENLIPLNTVKPLDGKLVYHPDSDVIFLFNTLTSKASPGDQIGYEEGVYGEYEEGVWMMRLGKDTNFIKIATKGEAPETNLGANVCYDSINKRILYMNKDGVYVFSLEGLEDDKPQIITQPQSQTVTEGNSVTFSVVATGTAPLIYQWFKDGAVISGATDSSYTIGSVKQSSAGSYMVMITNAQGAALSAMATLTVTQGEVPTLSIQKDGRKCLITFTGTLQESTDMKTWKNVTDTQNGVYTFTPVSEKRFFRAVQ